MTAPDAPDVPTKRERDVVDKEVKLERNFSFLSCLGLAFTTLNSWCGESPLASSVADGTTLSWLPPPPMKPPAHAVGALTPAMAASLPLVLPSGGSVSMVWGLVVSTIGTLAMTLSLADICHVLPTSGGQYDWACELPLPVSPPQARSSPLPRHLPALTPDVLAPPNLKTALSFLTAWNVTAGWVALGATAATVGARFIMGIVVLWNPSFERTAWATYLIFLAFTVVAFLLNVFAVRLLPLINRVSGVWSMVGIVVVVVTVFACRSGEFRPAGEVFASWTNETGVSAVGRAGLGDAWEDLSYISTCGEAPDQLNKLRAS